MLYRILQVLYETEAYPYYSASVASPEILWESLGSAALDIAAAPEKSWLFFGGGGVFLDQLIQLFVIYNCPECLSE